MNKLKKITMKECMNGVKVGKKLILGGIAYAYGSTSTNYGESIYIEGDFVAVNPDTKEQYSAPKLFLPPNTHDSLVKRLDNRKDQAEVIEIGIQIEVVESDKSVVGYTFLISPIETKETLDRRAAMVAQLSDAATLQLENKSK